MVAASPVMSNEAKQQRAGAIRWSEVAAVVERMLVPEMDVRRRKTVAG